MESQVPTSTSGEAFRLTEEIAESFRSATSAKELTELGQTARKHMEKIKSEEIGCYRWLQECWAYYRRRLK